MKMNRIFTFFFYIFAAINVTADEANYIKMDITDIYPGMKLSDIPDLSLKDRPPMLLLSSDMAPYFTVESDGTLFHVLYYSDNNTVRAIYADIGGSSIKRFFTPEGVYIGMDYNDVLAAFPDIKFYRFPGEYIAILPSGWKIGVIPDYQSGQNFPKQGDKIIKIYKDRMTIRPDAPSVN